MINALQVFKCYFTHHSFCSPGGGVSLEQETKSFHRTGWCDGLVCLYVGRQGGGAGEYAGGWSWAGPGTFLIPVHPEKSVQFAQW